jgi:hypothetical protein
MDGPRQSRILIHDFPGKAQRKLGRLAPLNQFLLLGRWAP